MPSWVTRTAWWDGWMDDTSGETEITYRLLNSRTPIVLGEFCGHLGCKTQHIPLLGIVRIHSGIHSSQIGFPYISVFCWCWKSYTIEIFQLWSTPNIQVPKLFVKFHLSHFQSLKELIRWRIPVNQKPCIKLFGNDETIEGKEMKSDSMWFVCLNISSGAYVKLTHVAIRDLRITRVYSVK